MVGEGQGQAGKRRQWLRREEERARWDRQAQWLMRTTGRPLARRGDFLLLNKIFKHSTFSMLSKTIFFQH